MSNLLHVFLNTEKNRLVRKEGRRKIEPKEGSEGQDEVKKDTGGKPVKRYLYPPVERTERQTSKQPIHRQRSKARWLNQALCNQK